MRMNRIRNTVLAVGVALSALSAPACFAQSSPSALPMLSLNYQRRPPDWAVGNFQGTNRLYKFDINMTISGFGNISGTTRGDDGSRDSFSGRYTDGYVRIRGRRYTIEQIFRGIRITDERNSRNTANLSKFGGEGGYDPDEGGGNSGGGGGGTTRPPDWARGTFSGYNDKYNADIELSITSSGSVTETVRDEKGKTYTYRGNWRNGRVRLDNNDFDIRRERDGVRLTQVGERTNTVYLDRGSSGGNGGSDTGDRPPSWAIGTFRGYNSKYKSDIELTVNSSGRVTERITQDDGKKYTVTGYWRDDLITLDNNDFEVRREGSGFRLTQVGERSNTVSLRRR